MFAAFTYALILSTAAAYDGVTVTWKNDEVRRGLADATQCADITFDGLEEGSIVSSLAIGSGIEGSESIGGSISVYGYRGLQRRNMDNPDYPIRQPALNRVSLFSGDIVKDDPLSSPRRP